jgi:hypothetical protein
MTLITVNEFLAGPVQDDPLIKNGRYQIVPKDGEKAKAHTRITNFAKKLEDEFNLTMWKQRMVLLGAAHRSDIVVAALAASDDKKELDRLAESAMEAAKANVRRDTGTALHKLCERLDAGETLEELALPETWHNDLVAYMHCLEELHADIEMSEQVVVCPKLGLAGRFDRTVLINGERFIMDIKTGRDLSYNWGSIAIQLALYAGAATIYDPERKSHRPMPKCDQSSALVLHLPAEEATCTPYWINLEEGRKGIAQVSELLTFRKSTKNFASLAIRPHTPARPELRDYVFARVRYVMDSGHADELARNWPDGVETLKHYDEHSEQQLDLILDACEEIEGRHRMVFPDLTDPRGLGKF